MPELPVGIGAGELPAAQTLAAVEKGRSAHSVELPPRFARAALERLLAMHHARGTVIEGPDAGRAGAPLAEGEWALVLSPDIGAPLKLVSPPRWLGAERVHVFPKYRVVAAPADAARLLRALEEVKPDERDADGRPLPWVPARQRVEAFGERQADDADVIALSGAHELPAPRADRDGASVWQEWLAALTTTAGLRVPELVVTRDAVHRYGFVSGRVFLDAAFQPLRVELVRCPNADLAETLSTLCHELAHAAARTKAHDAAFKRATVDLAARHFGERFFAGAVAHLERAYRVVDYWIVSGIRAALKGGEPPQLKSVDDGQLARILSRIKKLRDLAADQAGLPEGIAAAAAASDLITTYGLEGYGVLVGEVHDQMVDRWVPLEESAVWRRTLAHAVARYCEVFSLNIASQSRMHFFGRYADVVAAEYLYAVSAARIARECDAHLVEWKQERRRSSGQTRRERHSFCDSAAVAFQKKLERIAREEGNSTRALEAAEELAEREHEKRGKSWGTGGRRAYRLNAAGFELGGSLEVLHGVAGAKGAKGLPHR